MENAGPRSRGPGAPGSRGTGYRIPGFGKHETRKTRGLVENTGSGGKHGVWKTRGEENTGSGGKHGVSVENKGSR